MLLKHLVAGFDIEVIGHQDLKDIHIKNICYDSRKVTEQSLFVCIKGYHSDGHEYAKEAVQEGAVALIVERELDVPCVQIVVGDSREALAFVSSIFFDKPNEKIKLIGVTGTNGKTTICHMIKSILDSKVPRVPSGLIGTIGIQIGDGEYLPVNNTSPESLEFQGTLHNMISKGVKYVVTEVSSHGLEEHRVDYCNFDVAVFANLSQDHLDFHKSMENYFLSKAKLFSKLKESNSFAVVNIDDQYGARLTGIIDKEIITYGMGQGDVQGRIIEATVNGTKFNVSYQNESMEINLPLAGDFNVSNALAACSVVLGMGYNLLDIRKGLENLPGIPGRLEKIQLGQKFSVYIDFAHTPDGLEKVLANLVRVKGKRLLTVFGCPGNSDIEKRPIMARIAEDYSDLVIVTTDNPKYEAVEEIFSDIVRGFNKNNFKIIEDRKAAVEAALVDANEGDIVLLAGKGHENYQLIKGVKIPYSDKEVVYKYLLDC